MNFREKALALAAISIFTLVNLSCGSGKKHRALDDPEEYFLAFPTNPREEVAGLYSAEDNVFELVRYDEVLINNSSFPFRIVYRQRIIRSPEFGEIAEDKNYDIKKRFGKDTIKPKGQLFSDRSVFTARGNIKNVVVTVKYCGHKVTKKGKPITDEGHVTKDIKDSQLTCTHYQLEVEPNRKFEERREKRFDYVYY